MFFCFFIVVSVFLFSDSFEVLAIDLLPFVMLLLLLLVLFDSVRVFRCFVPAFSKECVLCSDGAEFEP